MLRLEKMLRIYFLQWFNLSDPAMEDALYDIESLRRFAGIELGQDEGAATLGWVVTASRY